MVAYCILTWLLVYYIALWLWYRYTDNRSSGKEATDKVVPENKENGYTLIKPIQGWTNRDSAGQIGTPPASG